MSKTAAHSVPSDMRPAVYLSISSAHAAGVATIAVCQHKNWPTPKKCRVPGLAHPGCLTVTTRTGARRLAHLSLQAPGHRFLSTTSRNRTRNARSTRPCTAASSKANAAATVDTSRLPAGGRTILLTGAAGFIGSHTAEALLARGDTVVAVDEVNDAYSTKLKEANLELLRQQAAKLGHPSRLHVVRASVADRAAMTRLFDDHRVDAVCHLAARAGVRTSLRAPELYIDSNIKGSVLLMELAGAASVTSFVYASSSSVYGDRACGGKAGMEAFRETDDVNEQVSPYAASKRAVELMAWTYHSLYKTPMSGLRFFTVYGPRGRPDMAPFKFVDRISRGVPIERFGDGSSWRDYTYISDIVDGVIAAVDRPLGYQVFNLGCGNPVRLQDFIAGAEAAVGRKAEVIVKEEQKGDVGGTYADITKAAHLLGYSPKVRLQEGLQKTMDWYKANPYVHGMSA
eukprot:jgi/Mesvir1/366/Mv18351-RA.4